MSIRVHLQGIVVFVQERPLLTNFIMSDSRYVLSTALNALHIDGPLYGMPEAIVCLYSGIILLCKGTFWWHYIIEDDSRINIQSFDV